MRKFIKRAKLPFFCAMLAAVVLAACLWVYPAANALTEREPEGYGGILRLWHIDSFEGGKGSRAAFLRNAAKEFSERTGVFILVTVHTPGSAEAALERGEPPDMLSCGSEPFAAELAVPLEGYDFAPARAGGENVRLSVVQGRIFSFRCGRLRRGRNTPGQYCNRQRPGRRGGSVSVGVAAGGIRRVRRVGSIYRVCGREIFLSDRYATGLLAADVERTCVYSRTADRIRRFMAVSFHMREGYGQISRVYRFSGVSVVR